jgi:hypothetical protein
MWQLFASSPFDSSTISFQIRHSLRLLTLRGDPRRITDYQILRRAAMTEYCSNHPEHKTCHRCQWCGITYCDLCLEEHSSLVPFLCPDVETMLKIITVGE